MMLGHAETLVMARLRDVVFVSSLVEERRPRQADVQQAVAKAHFIDIDDPHHPVLAVTERQDLHLERRTRSPHRGQGSQERRHHGEHWVDG
jgi:hypothetical protein